MSWYKGGVNCCCLTTPESCIIASDNFTRTPTTDSGWKTPGTVNNIESGVSWSGTGNVGIDDGLYASVTLNTGEFSKPLECSNFGLTIPATALVTGIEVRYRRFSNLTNSVASIIRFYTNGNELSTNAQDPPSGRWQTTETEVTFGSSTDAWSLTLTPDLLNSSSFSVRILASNTGASATGYIDLVQIRVHYTTSPIGSGWAVVSGNWNMLNAGGDHCVTTEDANAQLRFETAHPNAVAEHVVLIGFKQYIEPWTYWNLGDKLRISLCNNNLFVEIELGYNRLSSYCNSACIVVRLFNGTTLVQESKPIGLSGGTNLSLWGGYSATTGFLWAALQMNEGGSPTTVYMKENVGTISGTKVGIATGDSVDGRLIISNFNYYHHNYGTTITNCYSPGSEEVQNCYFANSWYHRPEDPITEFDCGWTVVSGTWKAGAAAGLCPHATYIETSSANALIKNAQDQSSWNCSEYTNFGYHKAWVYMATLSNTGDKIRIYCDYNGTDGHWAEISCGNSTGLGCVVKLGKGATVLETIYPQEGPLPGGPFQLWICTYVADSGHDAVSITAEGFYSSSLPGNNDWTFSAVSYTTVYGYKRIGIGSGDTLTGPLRLYNSGLSVGSAYGKSNANACRDCSPSECPWCPAGDGPQGMIISLSGIIAVYGSLCDCTLLNGDYDVPVNSFYAGGSCTGQYKQWFWCNYGGYWDFYILVAWEIVEKITGGWTLIVTITIHATGFYPPSDFVVIFKKDFAASQRCDTLSGEVLTYDSDNAPPNTDQCNLGGGGVTVTVSSY